VNTFVIWNRIRSLGITELIYFDIFFAYTAVGFANYIHRFRIPKLISLSLCCSIFSQVSWIKSLFLRGFLVNGQVFFGSLCKHLIQVE